MRRRREEVALETRELSNYDGSIYGPPRLIRRNAKEVKSRCQNWFRGFRLPDVRPEIRISVENDV